MREKAQRPSFAPGDRPWRADMPINKSQSQANIPLRKIDVASHISTESIMERKNEEDGVRPFRAKKKHNSIVAYPTTEKKKES